MTRDAVLHRTTTATGHSPRPRPWPRVSAFALEHFLLLPAGLLAALAWANAAAESYFRFSYAAAFWVNDVAMVFFFGVLMKEVVEATAPGGVLHSWRRAAMPLAGAAGAAIASALLYLWFIGVMDEPTLERAWPVAITTDLALAYFMARVIFGAHPIVPFVLLLGIATNAVAFVVLPVVTYPALELHIVTGGALMAGAVVTAAALRNAQVRSFWPYVVLAGGLSWCALYWAGVHPGLALVPIVPFIPHAARDRGFLVDAPAAAHDALSRFEQTFRVPMHVALLLFGLVNGGVVLRALEVGAWAVPIAALVGKPLGILLAAATAVAVGFHLPRRVGWRELLVASLIASSGFTVALFMASAGLAPGQVLAMMRIGVLLSVLGAPIGWVVARLLRVGRYER
jgi:NhaA family Na+:H+ antiporter